MTTGSGPESTAQTLRDYLLATFLPGEDPASLEDDTPLISSGIVDSIATLKLVSFLEERFSIVVEAHEVDVEYLNTVEAIVRFVESKMGSAAES